MAQNKGYLKKIEDAVQSITQDNGLIEPADLVALGSDPKSPIHDHFEWDNEKASDAFRLNQARVMIGTVKVKLINKKVQKYVNVRVLVNNEKKSGYMPIQAALARQDTRDQVLAKALGEIQRWQDRYESYQELSSIIDKGGLEQLRAEIQGS